MEKVHKCSSEKCFILRGGGGGGGGGQLVKMGCFSSSEEVGRSSGLTSRQRMVRSLRAGFEKSGRGGADVALPI